MLTIEQAQTDHALQQARELFSEYATGLGVDLSFQQFDQELATLPGALFSRRANRLLSALT